MIPEVEMMLCEKCGLEVPKRMMGPHRRYECVGIPRRADEGGTPPGTIIGSGPGAYKKRWTWADLERAYPKHTWIHTPANSNPPGGITFQGLHLELVPFEGGCFLSTGARNGERPVYSRGVPPPHWDIHQESLKTDRSTGSLISALGFGQTASPQAGTLEPQIFVNTETGDRVVNPY